MTLLLFGSANQYNIDRLLQERRNSIANALELHLSCTNPLIWWHCYFLALQIRTISIGYCKKDVTPLLTHWSYIFLALTHWYDDIATFWLWQILLSQCTRAGANRKSQSRGHRLKERLDINACAWVHCDNKTWQIRLNHIHKMTFFIFTLWLLILDT